MIVLRPVGERPAKRVWLALARAPTPLPSAFGLLEGPRSVRVTHCLLVTQYKQ